MLWRLGLDLGTNSIGWAVIELNEKKEPEKLIDLNTRIFSDGRDPKTKEPLAVARRTARGIRRSLYRKKIRRKNLFKELQKQGLFPSSLIDSQLLKIMNPYELRMKALDERLEPYELGRTLFHLGVRRGFKSNRKDITDSSSEMKDEKKIAGNNVLDDKMTQNQKCIHLEQEIINLGYRTIGEFLWNERNKNSGIRFVPERTTYYPTRQLYITEFEKIREAQSKYYPDIDWEKIYNIIFYQRPLKPQERGKCQFMYDKERTFKAMPCSHKYRILQEVYNLRFYDELNVPQELTYQQQTYLTNELDTHKELTFNAIRKILNIQGTFNLETESRQKLNGNSTAVILRDKKRFGNLWDTLNLKDQDAITEKLITADENSQVLEVLQNYELTPEQKESICKVIFSSGTTSLCRWLTEQLVFKMEEKHIQFDKALAEFGFNHSEERVDKYSELPYYGQILKGSTMGANSVEGEKNVEKKYGKISNPTVHVALNQTRVVVNTLIKAYGKPAQIIVELSRDLKNSRDEKKKIEKQQAERAKQNRIIDLNITDTIPQIQHPGRVERMRFRLWQELGSETASRKCIYCGKVISSAELFSKNIEIEHILPFSRSLLDNESNLTLAHAHCNAFKGDRSPYEAFGTSPKGFDWIEIMGRVNSLKNPVKRSRFSIDAMERFEKDASFITRQLNDNRYLSKAARRYLTCIMDNSSDVWVIPGQMTKMLRDRWEIDSILKRRITEAEITFFNLRNNEIGEYKKNRFDHRHHALDAMVIGLVDRSLVQKIAFMNSQKSIERLTVPSMPFARNDVIQKVKNCVISFKPDHGMQGKLSKETLLGCIRKETIVSIANLKDEDIENIKSLKVKEKFEELTAEIGFKKAKTTLKDEYPSIRLYTKKFVTRVPVTSLKETNIADIVDAGDDGKGGIRKKIRDYIDARPGEKIEKIMQEFSETEWPIKKQQNKTYRIKKVRCYNHDQKPIDFPCVINGQEGHRYYGSDSYVCVVIWQIPPKKAGALPIYTGQFIRYDQLKHNKVTGKQEIPEKSDLIHPAGKKMCVLFKDDCIEFSENGIWKKARIAGFSTNDNRIDYRPLFVTSDILSWQITTNEYMLEKGWNSAKAQNWGSINILFGIKTARKISINPIGKVNRHEKKHS